MIRDDMLTCNSRVNDKPRMKHSLNVKDVKWSFVVVVIAGSETLCGHGSISASLLACISGDNQLNVPIAETKARRQGNHSMADQIELMQSSIAWMVGHISHFGQAVLSQSSWQLTFQPTTTYWEDISQVDNYVCLRQFMKDH